MTEIVRSPIYQQLNTALREMITSGQFGPGSKFLTEREISERFKVSRATTNKALSNLVSEGVLEFHKGVGTFVSRRFMAYDLRQLVSFTAKAEAAGAVPTTRVLLFERRTGQDVDAEVSAALSVSATDELFYMERIRSANGLAVIVERRYILASECPGLSAEDLSGSIYALWIGKYGLKIGGADQCISAVALDDADAALLDLRKGSACLLAVSTGYLESGAALWFERTLYRGDSCVFMNRLAGLVAGQVVTGMLRMVQG